MFSRSKDTTPPTTTDLTLPAPQSKGRGRTTPSIISADLTVSGTLISTGDMQIDGTVEGDIRSVTLTVGDKAVIQGNVFAEEITVRGRIVGKIRARKVTLSSTSRVEGDILHEALAIEAGAYFDGNCRHTDNPLAVDDVLDMKKPAQLSAPMPSRAAASPMSGTPMAAASTLTVKPPVIEG